MLYFNLSCITQECWINLFNEYYINKAIYLMTVIFSYIILVAIIIKTVSFPPYISCI